MPNPEPVPWEMKIKRNQLHVSFLSLQVKKKSQQEWLYHCLYLSGLVYSIVKVENNLMQEDI